MEAFQELLRLNPSFQPHGDLSMASALVLSGKDLSHVPEAVTVLSHLVRLDVFSGKLSRVPAQLSSLHRLRQLRISGKDLKEVPASLSKLRGLRELRIFENQIRIFPFTFDVFSSLEILQISHNLLGEIPESILSVPFLRELRADANEIRVIPQTISRLTRLRLLSLEGNKISDIPPEIGYLRLLRVLSIPRNMIEVLPDTICLLTELDSLEIWQNKISRLPENIGNLTRLSKFEFWNNNIEVLPSSIYRLSRLYSLWGFQNKFFTLPESIRLMPQVLTFSFDKNMLTCIPEMLFQLNGIKHMWIQENRISSIPSRISEMRLLQNFSIGYNQISELPAAIGSVESLKRLSVNQNKLSALPLALLQLSNLDSLDISGNEIYKLPESIGALTGLTKFDFYQNMLSELPESVSLLTKLREILLYGNQFTSIPDCISSLTDITNFSISDLQIHELPEWISRVTNLAEFDITNTQVDRIVDGATLLPCYSTNQDIASLDLNAPLIGYVLHQNLISLKDHTTKLLSFTKIDLSGNMISHLPESFSTLRNLKSLVLGSQAGGNQFKQLGTTLSVLTSLVSLRIDNNPLAEIPEWLTRFKALKEFTIWKTKVTAVPIGFKSLVCYDRSPHLQSLRLNPHKIGYCMNQEIFDLEPIVSQAVDFEEFYLCHNQIIFIPETFDSLKYLRILDVSHNRILQLPDWIGNLAHLEEFDFSGNLVSRFPVSMGNLAHLKRICFEGNPINYPNSSVLEGGLAAIQQFLKSEMQGSLPWMEMRVLVTGSQGSGKTTLLQSLAQSGKFRSTCDKQARSTIGIETQPLRLTVPGIANPVTAMFWDCGGNEEFQITHPFFYSAGAIYLIVWDMSLGAQASRVDEWAALIASVAPGSRVIVVGTKVDELHSENTTEETLRMTEMKRILAPIANHLQIVDYITVSNQSGRNIAELRDMIAATISRSLKTTHAAPASHVCIKRICESVGRTRDNSMMSLYEFSSICHSIDPTLNPDSLLTFLCDRGVVVWHSNERFRDFVVCHPPFLQRVFLQVFNLVRSRKTIGAYRIVDLQHQFEIAFPGLSEHILYMFRSLRLSFPMHDLVHEIFPAILPFARPPMTVWPSVPPRECRSYASVRLQLNLFPRGLFGYITTELQSVCEHQQLSAPTVSYQTFPQAASTGPGTALNREHPLPTSGSNSFNATGTQEVRDEQGRSKRVEGDGTGPSHAKDGYVESEDEPFIDFYSANCFVGRIVLNPRDPQSPSCLCLVEADHEQRILAVSIRVFDNSLAAHVYMKMILAVIDSCIQYYQGIEILQRTALCPLCASQGSSLSRSGGLSLDVVHPDADVQDAKSSGSMQLHSESPSPRSQLQQNSQSPRQSLYESERERHREYPCGKGHILSISTWRHGLTRELRSHAQSLARISNLPGAMLIEQDPSISNVMRSAKLYLLCDNPAQPHKTTHAGFLLTESILRKDGLVSHLLPILKDRADLCAGVEEVEGSSDGVKVRFVFQHAIGTFVSAANPHLRVVLSLLDPVASWQRDLREFSFANSHVCFMCAECRKAYTTVHEVPIPNCNPAGAMHFRKDGMFSEWVVRHFVLAKEARVLIKHMEKLGGEEKDRISLVDLSLVSEIETEDQTFGFMLVAGWAKYYFKVPTSGERRAWMYHFQSLVSSVSNA
eukprot:TRINITY_DN4779_c0_g1_i1.p1 TRINITY_DN4779_c0_g1~~TRINITY_DN4779_c0_g1_i1.p1  ORF type:complete len:1654 (+),score=328.51 TRINITY_DN4779_c0_g1_i1:45-5006(+)